MSEFLKQIADRFGMSHEDLETKAGDVLDKYRDKIPDGVEGKLDDAIHGDLLDDLKNKIAPEGGFLDNLLEKAGIGVDEEAPAAEEPAEEETAEEVK